MAKKEKGNTVAAVWQIAQPIAESLGLELWDVRFVKEGADWFLRIFIDKEDGVSIDDCEAMSRAIDKPLDENGERDLCGTLGGLEGDVILLLGEDGAERRIPQKEASSVRLDDF